MIEYVEDVDETGHLYTSRMSSTGSFGESWGTVTGSSFMAYIRFPNEK